VWRELAAREFYDMLRFASHYVSRTASVKLPARTIEPEHSTPAPFVSLGRQDL